MTEAERPSAPSAGADAHAEWERRVLREVALAAVTEQRRARRWNVALRMLFLVYLFALLVLVRADLFLGTGAATTGKHTAVVTLDGVIAADAEANADDVIAGLEDAFAGSGVAGVALRINSPGGSPVQAGRINDAIRRLRKEHPKIPLYAVVEDLCASGGYYVAVAADAIYADKASLVGSIGVRMDGFGFVDTLDKLGVERRLLTAGAHKGFLDPFLPEDQADVAHARQMLAGVHEQFIAVVREGRGDRLKDNPDLFSGWVWNGEQGVELGLVDALGDINTVADKVIGAKETVDYTHRPGYFDRLAEGFGTKVAAALVSKATGQSATLR